MPKRKQSNVTLVDVSKRAQVSLMTASRAMNPNSKIPVSKKTREIVSKAARELGYRPNASARAMRHQKSKHIGVLMRNAKGCMFTNVSAFEMVLGINDIAEHEDYVVSLIHFEELEKPASRIFRENMLDGVIVVGEIPDDMVERLEELFPHIIWLDTNVWRPTNCVHRDELDAGRKATEVLVAHGCKKLIWAGFLPDPDHYRHYSANERFEGFLEVAQKHKLPYEHLSFHSIFKNEWHELYLNNIFSSDRLCGVACDSFALATRFMHNLVNFGWPKGKKIGLTACDEQREHRETWPNISCMRIKRFELGRTAAQMLLKILDTGHVDCKSSKIKGIWQSARIVWDGVSNCPIQYATYNE